MNKDRNNSSPDEPEPGLQPDSLSNMDRAREATRRLSIALKDNSTVVEISPDTYWEAFTRGLWDSWNQVADIIIDTYETEEIGPEHLAAARSELTTFMSCEELPSRVAAELNCVYDLLALGITRHVSVELRF